MFAFTAFVTEVEALEIASARADEALLTAVFVFAFTAVFPVEIASASDDDAFVTSDCTANDPELSPAPVRVREPKVQTCDAVSPVAFVASCRPIDPGVVNVDVATFHTSAASVPNVVSEREADDQTLSGIVAARDVDAVNTVAFVLLLMVVTAEVIWLFVLAFILAASEVLAERTAAFVFVLTAPVLFVTARARADDAFPTTVLVFELTAVFPFEIASASADEALLTAVFVFAFTPDVILDV